MIYTAMATEDYLKTIGSRDNNSRIVRHTMQTVYFYIDANVLFKCSEDTLARLSQTRNRNTCDESDEVADMLPIFLLSSKLKKTSSR